MITIRGLLMSVVGMVVLLRDPRSRDQRGLSQSAENAILLAGAVTVALLVVAVVTGFVRSRLPK